MHELISTCPPPRGSHYSWSQGLYVLATQDIFRKLKEDRYKHLTIWVSFFEIYGGKLFDLLNNRKKLVSREDGNKRCNIVGMHFCSNLLFCNARAVMSAKLHCQSSFPTRMLACFSGLREKQCDSPEALLQLIGYGNSVRSCTI